MMKYISKKYLNIIFTSIIILVFSILVRHISNTSINIQSYDDYQESSISKEEVVEIENMVRKGLIEGRESFSLKTKSIKSKDIFELIFDVIRDEPEIMYFSVAEHKKDKLKISYSQSKSKLKKDQISMRIKRDEIIEKIIDDSMTDYEKVKAVHDYIIDNTIYDLNMHEGDKFQDESYTAYGTLVSGVGVCEGYAKALKYILDEIGIENLIVIGSTKDHKHAWNQVKLDGDYYHIDLTWDDPLTGGCQGVIHYTYFCLTDEKISRTHFWKKDKYPEAKGELYNYFSYHDLIVSNKNEFVNKIKSALMGRCVKILLKYEDYKRDDISLSEIIADIEHKENIIMLESYDYCIDECQGVFNIYFKYYDRQCYFLN